jgi:hypothetical protein
VAEENLDEKKLYLVGSGDKQIAMPESEMVRRIEEWYDNLSDKDQTKFRERLWAPIRELGEQQMSNEPRPDPKPEPREPSRDPDPTREIDPSRLPRRPQ